MIKWSKRIAIQYIQEMRSPIEEMARQGQAQGTGGNGHTSLERVRTALRQSLLENRNK